MSLQLLSTKPDDLRMVKSQHSLRQVSIKSLHPSSELVLILRLVRTAKIAHSKPRFKQLTHAQTRKKSDQMEDEW